MIRSARSACDRRPVRERRVSAEKRWEMRSGRVSIWSIPKGGIPHIIDCI